MTLAYTSQPWTSVPKTCSPPGRSALSDRSQARGSGWPNQPANQDGATAISSSTPSTLAQSQNSGRRRSVRQTPRGAAGASASTSVTAVAVRVSLMADPRVEHRRQQVHDQVRQQEDDDQRGGDADDGRPLVRADRLEQQLAD